MTNAANDIESRRHWMGVLAKSSAAEVARLWPALGEVPAWTLLRRPEIGLVMVRGRMGGDGAPFNLGEMTVTRCSVRLHGGFVGHAWVAGRSADHAEKAAIADALLQDPAWRDKVEVAMLAPLDRLLSDAKERSACKAAATRVDFFTMVRGED